MEYAMTVRTGASFVEASARIRQALQALDPRAIAAVAGHPELTGIAEDAAARLRAPLDALPPAR